MSGVSLPVITTTLTLGNPDPQSSIQPFIDALKTLASSLARVVISYGASEFGGLWHITNLTVNGTKRNLSNQVTRATVDMELSAVSDVTAQVGPVSGGVNLAPSVVAAPAAVAASCGALRSGRTATRKSGGCWLTTTTLRIRT
jgi:hypothetical protein